MLDSRQPHHTPLCGAVYGLSIQECVCEDPANHRKQEEESSKFTWQQSEKQCNAA